MRRIITILLASALALTVPAQTKTKARKPATTTAAKSSKSKKTVRKSAVKAVEKPAPTSIKGLRNERAAIQRKIKQQEQALRANKANVSKRLKDLLVINSEIGEKQKSIDGIQQDINHIDGNIGILQSQLQTLEK